MGLVPINDDCGDYMEEKEKSFDEQIEDLRKELENLPEDQQEMASKVLENYAERSNKGQVINDQIEKYLKDHPDFDVLCISKRPDDMPYEAYKVLRKASNNTIKEYVKCSKRRLVRLRKG